MQSSNLGDLSDPHDEPQEPQVANDLSFGVASTTDDISELESQTVVR